MYTREEEFWAQRLAALQPKQRPATSGSAPLTLAYIPAYIPPASQPRPPTVLQSSSHSPSQSPSTALVRAAGATATAISGPTAADLLVQAAQVEALKLQVSQLRRENAALQQQVASMSAERAAAAKREAIQQLAALRLQPLPASAPGGAAVDDGTAAALQEELGVVLPAGEDSVPLLYLQQLHTNFQRRLAELQQQHAVALQRRADETEVQLRRQAEQHAREVRLLTEGLEDPARDAEVQLLRDDCRYLKEKVQQLGVEYQRRVEVAAAEARLKAQQQAAEQLTEAQAAAAAEQQRLQAQFAQAQEAAAAAAGHAGDDAALERARHAAELARLREQHAAAMDAIKVECAASLQEREVQYIELLRELHQLRAAMSAPPSRAGTRQEAQHPAGFAGWEPAGLPMQPQVVSWQQGAAADVQARGGRQQQHRLQQRGPALAPGQLMELLSDEEEEQPRQAPQLLQRLQAGHALLQHSGQG